MFLKSSTGTYKSRCWPLRGAGGCGGGSARLSLFSGPGQEGEVPAPPPSQNFSSSFCPSFQFQTLRGWEWTWAQFTPVQSFGGTTQPQSPICSPSSSLFCPVGKLRAWAGLEGHGDGLDVMVTWLGRDRDWNEET